MFRAISISLTLLAVVGCQSTSYEIEMRPAGVRIHRKLAVASSLNDATNDQSHVDESVVARLSKQYSEAGQWDENGRLCFEGVFGPELPSEHGGDGHYECYQSPLGNAYVYSERWIGSLNRAERFQQLHSQLVLLSELIGDFIAFSIDDAAWGDAIREWLKGPFRSDIASALFGRDLANWNPLATTMPMSDSFACN
ncbi:MAG: hypothetical protein AAGJ40_20905 [Planctomycetota bacterium]